MLLYAYLLFWNLSTMGGVFLGLLLGGGAVSKVLSQGGRREGQRS
jgi:hypothetical protein